MPFSSRAIDEWSIFIFSFFDYFRWLWEEMPLEWGQRGGHYIFEVIDCRFLHIFFRFRSWDDYAFFFAQLFIYLYFLRHFLLLHYADIFDISLYFLCHYCYFHYYDFIIISSLFSSILSYASFLLLSPLRWWLFSAAIIFRFPITLPYWLITYASFALSDAFIADIRYIIDCQPLCYHWYEYFRFLFFIHMLSLLIAISPFRFEMAEPW